MAPPEGGAGAGAAAAAAPPEEKSGWRSRRSLDGLEVLKGKHNFKISLKIYNVNMLFNYLNRNFKISVYSVYSKILYNLN